jgi:hypothetical protein
VEPWVVGCLAGLGGLVAGWVAHAWWWTYQVARAIPPWGLVQEGAETEVNWITRAHRGEHVAEPSHPRDAIPYVCQLPGQRHDPLQTTTPGLPPYLCGWCGVEVAEDGQALGPARRRDRAR